jgi:hypothetical protein
MTEPSQLTLDPPMSPPRILSGKPQHERLDRGSGGGTSGAAARAVVPLPGDEPAMPAGHSTGSDREDLSPAPTMHQPGQGGEPESVCGHVADRARQLPTKHRVLVPQHERSASFAASLRSSNDGTDSNFQVSLYSRATITRTCSQSGELRCSHSDDDFPSGTRVTRSSSETIMQGLSSSTGRPAMRQSSGRGQ